MTLADLGARVVKIESPEGDEARGMGPFKDGHSLYFASVNRGKQSVVLNLKNPAERKIAQDLASKADVLVENFKVGNLARYGLGYDDLKKDLPSLVYCSITGFGQTGPYAERPGYDPLIQAMGGVMSVTGDPDGEPQKVGVPIADLMAGMYASVAVTSALRSRELTGKGQYVDISMLDTHVAWLSIQAMNYLVSGEVPKPIGSSHSTNLPVGAYQAEDGSYVQVHCPADQFAQNLFRLMADQVDGMAELASDPRFADRMARIANRDALDAVLSDAFESIINVAAAVMILYTVWLTNRPADHEEFGVAGVAAADLAVGGVVV